MRHSLLDYNKSNMDKHCSLSYFWYITELFEGSSYFFMPSDILDSQDNQLQSLLLLIKTNTK